MRYTIYLKHDNGIFETTVTAGSIAAAIEIVKKQELCPERAIYKITDYRNKEKMR